MEGYQTPPTAGPRPIGQIGAIAKGTYTEIVEIIAPSEAAVGDKVAVTVHVKNLYNDYNYISVSSQFDDTLISFSPEYEYVIPWGECSFIGFFDMLGKAVRLHVWSYYWTGEEWYPDDYSYVDIALAAPLEVYAGTISRKELEYDGVRSGIPVL